ncbi:MAG: hypothetical protein ACRD4T_00055 [Candidatus Acidiferrales bacterium]
MVMDSDGLLGVLDGDAMLVPPKADRIQCKFRWSPDIMADLKRVAEERGRSVNDVSERLMRWAVDRALAELEEEVEPEAERGKRGRKAD